MNYPFSKKSSLGRFVTIALVLLLTLSLLSGCSLLPGKQPNQTTEPSDVSESTEPSSSELIEDTQPTEPSTEATVPPTTEAPKENVAIVKEQLQLRATPSNGGRVIITLDAGEELEVARMEQIGKVTWAYVNCESLNVLGWVRIDQLDMSNVHLSVGGSSTPGDGSSPTVGGPDPTLPTEAPTTAPVDPITGTGTGSNTTPANAKMGVVTANDLNIRSSASQNGDRVGSYSYGNRVAILETNNGWGRTDKGWISLNYVYMDGNTGTNTASGTVTATQLNVRSGPGTNYDKVTSLSQNARVQILEQIKVGNDTWGYTNGGWVSMQFIAVDGAAAPSVPNVPSNGTAGTGTATVTGNALNVRAGAGTGYQVVATVKQGDVVTILETAVVDNVKWGRIYQGWICLDYVRMN